jgi:hypothetical protein
MAKSKVVVFTTNNARILTGADPAAYRDWPNALIDPDFSKVSGVAPHFWEQRDGEIVKMEPESRREARVREIEERGADNDIRCIGEPRTHWSPIHWAAIGAGAAGLLALGAHLLHWI